MSTSYRVTTSTTGAVLGLFPEGELAAAMDLVTANPGASIKPVATITIPCAAHRGSEADNCPDGGTSQPCD